ncbi:hypothetical protein [Dictyobacter arantiisoli]|uniref:Uncharacterized protein n=1 Tax=Dictyobacter arantiisoli TaxID=2014874 RepID=A0A5A5T899_9CHLR|nr:hypothetical protein [Dictyobacter arantiisoli]GCF07386.1 hypothetical protein KDI_09500 [Dictyobacter arantiisoli]
MTTPVQIGWPQLLLFIIAVIGVGLLISSLMGLFKRRREMEIFEDEYGQRYRRWRKHHRELRWKRGTGGILLLVLSISLLWLTFAIQSYLGLTSDIKVAQIEATSFTNAAPQMSVKLTLLDTQGKPTSSQTDLMNGDMWELQCNVLKFPSWMNIFGIHSSFKLTRLEGTYSDPALEANSKHTVVELNGGAGDFFKSVYKQAWTSPFVDAAYGGAVLEPADGHTYDIYMSQTGLYAKPAGK